MEKKAIMKLETIRKVVSPIVFIAICIMLILYAICKDPKPTQKDTATSFKSTGQKQTTSPAIINAQGIGLTDAHLQKNTQYPKR